MTHREVRPALEASCSWRANSTPDELYCRGSGQTLTLVDLLYFVTWCKDKTRPVLHKLLARPLLCTTTILIRGASSVKVGKSYIMLFTQATEQRSCNQG